jgi:[CysO sulfur-carrier protein]-S-L-cysteine hydrolase
VNPVILSAPARHLVEDHVRKALPQEAIGLLAGDDQGKVELVLPLSNISNDRYSFLADPFEQYKAMRHIKGLGLKLLAIYHSHPGGGSTPSSADLKYAQAWNCWNLVLAVNATGAIPEKLQAFRCLSCGSLEFSLVKTALDLEVMGPIPSP